MEPSSSGPTYRWVSLGGSILLFFVLFLIFLPNLVSTKVGKKLLLQALSYPLEAQIKVKKLQLSWLGPQQLDKVFISSPKGKISIDRLLIESELWYLFRSPKSLNALPKKWEIKKGSYVEASTQNSLHHFYASGWKQKQGESVSFHMQIKAELQEKQAPSSGSFSFLAHLFTPIKKENWQGEIELKTQRFPTFFLPPAYRSMGQEILGDFFHSTLHLHWKPTLKPFTFSLKSPYLEVQSAGNLHATAIELTYPAKISFQLAPLKKRSSLLKGVQSLTPATLILYPEKTYLPLFAKDWGKINIPKATLDLGKMACKNQEFLSLILNALHIDSLFSKPELILWFAPAELSLQGEELTLKRMDFLLVPDIPMLLAGKIEGRSHNLHLYLGISPAILQRLFSLRKTPSDLFTFPIEGTLRSPHINTSAIAAKIASLTTTYLAPDLFSPLIPPGKEPTIPPPNLPFPWEK